MSSTANFERLSRLVAKHETFWASLAQRSESNPHNEAVIKAWLRTQWDPWFTAFGDAIAQGPLNESGISAAARGLTALRALAQSEQWKIPVPRVSEETTAAIAVSGGPRGGGAGHIAHARPAAFTRPRAHERPAHARPRGFRGRGGWYRHGSRFPGRWWWGPAGWAWVESDVNLIEDPNQAVADEAQPDNAPAVDEAPIAPEAQGEPADDVAAEAADAAETGADADSAQVTNGGSTVSGADGNPIVDAINAETDRRFWQQTGYARGRTLDRTNPRDRKMLPTWLRIRYQVALDFSARSREAYARGETLDADDVFVTPREQTFSRHASPSSLYAQSQSDAPVESSGAPFGGALVGCGSLVALGAIVSPGAKGTTVSFARDGSILTATICVDGRCSSGSIDLGPMVNELHQDFHADPRALIAGDAMALMGASAIEYGEPTGAAELVGALLQNDTVALCGSWWSSVTGAVKGAGHAVRQTIHKVKGPLGIAAGAAAGAAALAIPGAGPVLAPMAASLAHSMVDAAAGDASAAQVVQQAQAQATSDQTVAHALALATKSAAQTTAAAHVVQTVDQAIAGSPVAKQAVAELHQAATYGDPGAQQIVALAQQVAQGVADQQAAGAGAAVSSGVAPDLRGIARGLADLEHGQVIGVAIPVGNSAVVKVFASADDADDWYGRWLSMPHAFEYVAYFDKGDSTYPGPLNEQFGTVAHAATRAHAASGHWLLPLALGGGAAAAGVHFGPRAYKWISEKLHKHA